MQKTSTSPDKFLDSLREDKREDMKKLDKLIREVMTGETRVMWEGVFWGGTTQNIIGYGDYTYERPKGNVEWFKIGLSLQKNYISLYVNAVEGKEYLAEKYKNKLGKAKIGKSSISFDKLSEINLEVLKEMVAKTKVLMS